MPEARTMSARYSISESDYVRATALGAKLVMRVRSVEFLFLALGIALFVGAILAYNITQGPGSAPAHGAGLGTVFIWVVAWLIGFFVIRPWTLRRRYRQSKMIHDEQVITLLDDGVRIASPGCENRLAWNKILKWRLGAGYVLIYAEPGAFFIIPTWIAEQGFDMERLKTALTQHVGPPELVR